MNPKYLYQKKLNRLLRNSLTGLLLMVAIIYGVVVLAQLEINPLRWSDAGREFGGFMAGLVTILGVLHYYIEKESIRRQHPHES